MNEQYTEALILNMCNQPRTLAFITSRVNGLDPMTTLAFLQRLEKKELLRHNDGLWLLEKNAKQQVSDILNPNAQLYLKKYMGDLDLFKKPHPLDFEWRNTKRSTNYLADLILQSASLNDNILIFGMPTLFANLCRRDVAQHVTIVERNPGVISSLKELSNDRCKVIDADLFLIDSERIGTYSTVVMDPPWYDPHFYQFVWLANRCLTSSGRLLISIPSINTRPDIDVQRMKWFGFCQKEGLCIENLFAGKMEYTMPFFEWNAARVAGALTSPFWRKGDLATFQKLKPVYNERPSHVEDSSVWHEVEIDNCRVRVRIDQSQITFDTTDFTIIPVVSTQILPSVSNRDENRKKANVWTSGNRLFETNQPKKLFSYLQYCKEGIDPDGREASEVFDFIKSLVAMENEEHNQYLEWLYHEMEREGT